MPPKSLYASKTFWGVLLTLAPQLIDLAQSGALGPKAAAAVSAVGAIVAIWGRITARRPVTVKPPVPLLGLFLPCLLAMLVLPGCQSNGSVDTKLVARLAVSYGVSKVIEANPNYAERIATISHEVGAAAGGEASTVSAVMALARAKIDWGKLSPADTNLVNILLLTVEAELTKRVNAGLLSAEQALLVQEVAGWIETTARAYMPEGSASAQ